MESNEGTIVKTEARRAHIVKSATGRKVVRRPKQPLDTAAQRALMTTELLERILLALPWEKQFTLRRVCYKFRKVLKHSSLLRRHVFLERMELWGVLCNHYEPCPALRQCPPPPPLYNFRKIERFLCRDSKFFWLSLREGGNLDVASWKDLLLTDPPIKKVWAQLEWHVKGSGTKEGQVGYCLYTGTRQLEDPAGFTFGKMIDAALAESRWDVSFRIDMGSRQSWISPLVSTHRKALERLQEYMGGGEIKLFRALLMFNDDDIDGISLKLPADEFWAAGRARQFRRR